MNWTPTTTVFRMHQRWRVPVMVSVRQGQHRVGPPHVVGQQRLQNARRGKPIDFQQRVEVLCEAANYVKLSASHL
jgi:hypothetical protein